MKPETLTKRRAYAQQYYTTRERARMWLRAHPEKTKLYNQRQRQNQKRWAREHKDAVRAASRRARRKRRANGLEKIYKQRPDAQLRMTVQRMVYLARKLGILVKQPCQRCGDPKSLAHHEDYSRPLEVTWLCTPCHGLRHAELRALGIKSVMDKLLHRSQPASVGDSKRL